MRIISLCGNFTNEFAFSVCQALEKFGGALLLENDAIIQKYLYEPNFVICQYKDIPKLNISKAIIIESTHKGELIFSLFDYNHFEEKFKVGLNNTDDITVSSISNSNICISILSTIKTMSGIEFLPCEIKIKNTADYDIYIILAAVTILLLTDKIDTKFHIEV